MGERPDRPDKIGRDPLDSRDPLDTREPVHVEREISERAQSGDEVAQTRVEIERTRADMSETVDALQERLSPQNIKEQAKVQAKETAREAGSGFVDRIKQNPVPAAMVGIGLGWLLTSGGDSSSGRWRSQEGPYYYERSYPAYYEESSRSSGGQSSTGEAAGQAREKASQLGGQAQEGASQLSEGAREQAQRAKGGFQQMLQENPLAVGALAVGLGAAVGFSVPETDRENRAMGEARDNLVERGKEKAEEIKPKVQSVAEQARGAAREEAQNQDLTT